MQIKNISMSRTAANIVELTSRSTENYTCWVNNMNLNHTLEAMTTTVLDTLDYDTKYSIGCVELGNKVYLCTEYNTSTLTGESARNRNVQKPDKKKL